MQKKFVGLLSACLLASTIWTGTSLAASPYYDNDNHGQQKPGGEYGKPSGNGQSDSPKAVSKQLKSIDKQLTKIEQNLDKYESKFTKWTDEDEQDKDEDQNEDNPEAEVQTQQTAPTHSYALKSSDEETELDEDEDDELAEDINEAVEEYNEYTGKFTALSNRLGSVSKQLEGMITRGLDVESAAVRTARIEALKVKIQTSVDKMTTVQNQVINRIKNDHTVKVEESREEALTTKPWNIRFNKSVNEASLSELVIVVYDDQEQLIETSITYDPKKKTVVVQPTQPYKTGSKYTLYVGKELSSEGGQQLKNSVKMQFTIR